MIPQQQRWFRGAAFDTLGQSTDEGGDCFAACLASILEVPINGFPNMHDSRPYGDGGWWHRWQLWLYEHYRAELLWWERDEMPDPKTLAWWIAGVDPVATARHAVVFYADEFRWDPAPECAKRVYSLDDVRDGVGLFSIACIYNREDGPYVPRFDADGNVLARADGLPL